MKPRIKPAQDISIAVIEHGTRDIRPTVTFHAYRCPNHYDDRRKLLWGVVIDGPTELARLTMFLEVIDPKNTRFAFNLNAARACDHLSGWVGTVDEFINDIDLAYYLAGPG